jgi:GNAT superfamily N-acetyltransferase
VPTEILDLTRVEIRPLSPNTATNRFSCGNKPIDRFLKNRARKAEARVEYRTFCAHLDDSSICIGYYTLQLGTGIVAELPKTHDSYLTRRKQKPDIFPAVNLAYIGVDERYRRQGLGRFLIMDVFSKVAQIAEIAGFYALTLISYDDESTEFYKRIGFEIYVEGEQPKMLYPIQSVIDLVDACGEGEQENPV